MCNNKVNSSPPQMFPLGEKAVLVEFSNQIGEQWLNQVSSLQRSLLANPFPGLKEIVPAYASLAVYYDPMTVLAASSAGSSMFAFRDKRLLSSFSQSIYDLVCGYIEEALLSTETIEKNSERKITIPICYGGEFGPDLEEVACYHHLSTEEVINMHSQGEYRVYMIGFLPGFAYMGGLPAQLHTPRRATPRQNIAPGSVGIAGAQTGIYPLASPGGWQIIGRTPLSLFRPAADPPTLLKAGDIVRFQPIRSGDLIDWNELDERQGDA